MTCPAVDRLNYAQMYPIVIYTKAESKDVVKEIRTAAESKRKSTKKLIIEAQKLEKSSAFLFTGKSNEKTQHETNFNFRNCFRCCSHQE